MTSETHISDVAFIKALAELLRENDLTELDVTRDYGEDDSLSVRVSRAAPVVTQVMAPAAAPVAHTVASPAAAPALPASPDASDPSAHPGAVPSPMVGTVYMQAEPGAPPFIAVGAQVSEGDTLLIVEAMKTMNHIPAPHSGTVRRILVEDGASVEYGSPLVIID